MTWWNLYGYLIYVLFIADLLFIAYLILLVYRKKKTGVWNIKSTHKETKQKIATVRVIGGTVIWPRGICSCCGNSNPGETYKIAENFTEEFGGGGPIWKKITYTSSFDIPTCKDCNEYFDKNLMFKIYGGLSFIIYLLLSIFIYIEYDYFFYGLNVNRQHETFIT